MCEYGEELSRGGWCVCVCVCRGTELHPVTPPFLSYSLLHVFVKGGELLGEHHELNIQIERPPVADRNIALTYR